MSALNGCRSASLNTEGPLMNVTVTVKYTWMPEMYLTGPITLTGTSTLPMTH